MKIKRKLLHQSLTIVKVDTGSGYSGTPLIKKLGIKPGFSILALNAPKNYYDLLGSLPPEVQIADSDETDIDFIHDFETLLPHLQDALPSLRKKLKINGMLWLSWPKGTSKISTNLNRDIIRELVLQTDLVDVKVCAVDENWSGLKFVIRKYLR